jgi:protein phosphatase 1 regulatory subunit 7
VDLSFNCLRTLKYLNGLKYLTTVRATDNQLTSILELKEAPLHLDSLDLSGNRIAAIPDLARHRSLRVLRLAGNRITAIRGLERNKALRVLDLSENQIEEVQGLEGLGLTELYLSSNQIETAKGLARL